MKPVNDGSWYPSYSILDVIRQWPDQMDVLEILILMYQKWIWDRANRLLWWLNSKESACQCRRHRFDPWSGKIPWRRKWQCTPVFLSGKSLCLIWTERLHGLWPIGSQKFQTKIDLVTKQQQTASRALALRPF